MGLYSAPQPRRERRAGDQGPVGTWPPRAVRPATARVGPVVRGSLDGEQPRLQTLQRGYGTQRGAKQEQWRRAQTRTLLTRPTARPPKPRLLEPRPSHQTDCSPPDLFLGVLASHWLGHVCDARPWLIGQRKHSMPFFGAGLRSEAMEAPPTSVLGTHAREEGRWWQERGRI